MTFELIATLLHPDDLPAFEERVAQAGPDGRDGEGAAYTAFGNPSGSPAPCRWASRPAGRG